MEAANPTTLEHLVERAVELGKYQERMFWRQGLDESTGKRRELLGLGGRRQVKNGQQGNEMRTDNSFGARQGVQAQSYVDDLYERNPNLSWADMQRSAAKKFGFSAVTIKRNLKNPKKPGSGRSE